MCKREYVEVIDFVAGVGGKFDGIKIAGIIDVNKVFDSNNPDIILGYNKLLIRVVSDLDNILEWLISALPHTRLGHFKES